MDNKTPNSQESSSINLNEDYELKYWKEYFNVTAGRLRKAVEEAGPSVNAIEQYLRNCMFS